MRHSSSRRMRRRKGMMSEINVVPYIDVMLVLLIIFMVTAPLLNLGVDIELPQSAAQTLDNKDEPVLVSVDQEGNMYLTLSGQERHSVDESTLVQQVGAFMRENPDIAVLVGGDKRVDYGRIYQTMVMLQQAGVPHVGLMSQPESAQDK